jgi:hypothetical protein
MASKQLFNISSAAVVAQAESGRSLNAFLGSLGAAVTLFAVQFVVFYRLKDRLPHI